MKVPKIKLVETSFVLVDRTPPPEKIREVAERYMARNSARIALILDTLLNALDAGRRVLIVSHRLEQLAELHVRFNSHWEISQRTGRPPMFVHYAPGSDVYSMAYDDRRFLSHSEEVRAITVETREAEKVVRDDLDTLFLALPIQDSEFLESLVKRISDSSSEKIPIVVDFCDRKLPVFVSMEEYRRGLYASFVLKQREENGKKAV